MRNTILAIALITLAIIYMRPAGNIPQQKAVNPAAQPVQQTVVFKDIPKKDGSFDKRKNDLEELCRDYIHFRSKILYHHNMGEKEKADKARAMFQQVNKWLSAYKEEDVTEMIASIEKEVMKK